MPLTPSGESTVLNALYNSATFVGLHTGDPSGGGNEVSGGAYARQAWVINSVGSNPTVISNSAIITFPTATAGWGTITYAAIWTALTGGSVKAYQALAVAKTVSTDDVVRFQVGALSFSAD